MARSGTMASYGLRRCGPKLLMRVDPKTWMPEVAVSTYTSPDKPRTHDMTIDDKGNIWLVLGNDSKSYKEGRPGLVMYDGQTGEIAAHL